MVWKSKWLDSAVSGDNCSHVGLIELKVTRFISLIRSVLNIAGRVIGSKALLCQAAKA